MRRPGWDAGGGSVSFASSPPPTNTHHHQVTLPNPTNAWEDKEQGKFFSQTQVFLTNTDTERAICNVKVRFMMGCLPLLWFW